jgi:hypothetical protein
MTCTKHQGLYTTAGFNKINAVCARTGVRNGRPGRGRPPHRLRRSWHLSPGARTSRYPRGGGDFPRAGAAPNEADLRADRPSLASLAAAPNRTSREPERDAPSATLQTPWTSANGTTAEGVVGEQTYRRGAGGVKHQKPSRSPGPEKPARSGWRLRRPSDGHGRRGAVTARSARAGAPTSDRCGPAPPRRGPRGAAGTARRRRPRRPAALPAFSPTRPAGAGGGAKGHRQLGDGTQYGAGRARPPPHVARAPSTRRQGWGAPATYTVYRFKININSNHNRHRRRLHRHSAPPTLHRQPSKSP